MSFLSWQTNSSYSFCLSGGIDKGSLAGASAITSADFFSAFFGFRAFEAAVFAFRALRFGLLSPVVLSMSSQNFINSLYSCNNFDKSGGTIGSYFRSLSLTYHNPFVRADRDIFSLSWSILTGTLVRVFNVPGTLNIVTICFLFGFAPKYLKSSYNQFCTLSH